MTGTIGNWHRFKIKRILITPLGAK